jgi:hypothetical protein
MVTTIRMIRSSCAWCGAGFEQPDDPGRKRRYCSAACKQAAYRARKRREQQARQRAEEEAARRAREERARREEQARRAQTRRPPPPRPLVQRLRRASQPPHLPPRPGRPRPRPPPL